MEDGRRPRSASLDRKVRPIERVKGAGKLLPGKRDTLLSQGLDDTRGQGEGPGHLARWGCQLPKFLGSHEEANLARQHTKDRQGFFAILQQFGQAAKRVPQVLHPNGIG
jgi:hypothetical protein